MQDFEVDAAFSMGLLRGERIRHLVTGMLASARPVVATAHPGTDLAQAGFC